MLFALSIFELEDYLVIYAIVEHLLFVSYHILLTTQFLNKRIISAFLFFLHTIFLYRTISLIVVFVTGSKVF